MEDNDLTEKTDNPQKQGMKMTIPLVGIVVLVLIAGGYYMMRKNTAQNGMLPETKVQGVTQQMPEQTSNGTVEETVPENNNEIVIAGSSFKFSPNTFTVSAGQSVKLVFENTEGFHDLVFETLSIKTKQIQAGQKETLEFKAPEEPGEYEFYCSVGNHRAMGMEGKMVVR